MPYQHATISLYSRNGQRKYLDAAERVRFLAACQEAPPDLCTLCLTLAHTGCRVSEALALTRSAIHPSAGIIVFRTLKQRGRLVIREVPVPPLLLEALDQVHQLDRPDAREEPLWPLSRVQAWRRVKALMTAAGIGQVAASPRGLRHGYGVHAVHSGVPLPLIQRWLGHANLNTTAIYTNLVGPEELAMASRMWVSEHQCF